MPIVVQNAPGLRSISAGRVLAHDARNVLASLLVYSELLALPGVLMQGQEHYAVELGEIVRTSLRLIEKLAAAMDGVELLSAGAMPVEESESFGRSIQVTNVTYSNSNFSELAADASGARCLEC
jgi:hypothetical protein